MQKGLLVYTTVLILISCNIVNKPKKKPENYFDCNYYHYFKDTAYPTLSKQDSIDLIKLSIRFNFISQSIHGKDTAVRNALHLLPFLKNRLDTGWYSFIRSSAWNNFSFRSIKKLDISGPILVDAIFKGKVIAIRHPRDTMVCLHYNTEYVIQVTDLIHSYFPLANGNLVLAKSIPGFDCGSTVYYSSYSHIPEYDIGKETIFTIDRGDYQKAFLRMKDTGDIICENNDIYCPQAFEIYDCNWLTPGQVEDLKIFFKTKFTNHEYY